MKVGGLAVTLIALLIAFVSVFSASYTVDEGDRAIILRGGKAIGVEGPGLHFKVPFYDAVKEISARTFTYQTREVNVYTADSQPAKVNISVTYSVVPSTIIQFYSEFNTLEGWEQRQLANKVPSKAENILGRFTAVNAVQKRELLEKTIGDAIRAEVSPLVQIESVQLENTDFSDAYEKSIEALMEQEVAVRTKEKEADRKEIDNRIKVATAKADAEARFLVMKAEADGTEAKGQAEAKVLKAKAEILERNPMLVEQTKAEKWNGQGPTTVIGNGTTPFLQLQGSK